MTLYKLHDMLFEELEKVKNSDTLEPDEQKKILDSAVVFSSLSKQMINNADVILRSQKFISEFKAPDLVGITMLVSENK